VAVDGQSMVPTLLPGDWLLVDPDAFAVAAPVAGDLLVVADPRAPARLLVKRMVARDGVGDLIVAGDAPDASTDSRTFGAIDAAAVAGRPWFRYWPLARLGKVE
jgi:nickel-type superoxide dismutase maturation protease